MRRRRDYQSKQYKNPHIKLDNTNSMPKRAFYCFILFLAFSGALYFLFGWNFFNIKKIEVSGNKNISEIEIIDLVNEQMLNRKFIIFSQANIFLFNKNQLRQSLSEKIILQKVKIDRRFPDTIRIEIFEKEPLAILITQSKAYYMDLEGLIVSLVKDQAELNIQKVGDFDIFRHEIVAKNLPIIYDLENRGAELNNIIATEKTTIFIIELIKKLPKNINYDISYYEYDAKNREVVANIIEGWRVRFNIDLNLDSQIDNLAVLLRENIKDTRNLDYIDLRFGERVFYK